MEQRWILETMGGGGHLVISHDMGSKSSPAFESCLALYAKNNYTFPLALNIKADGLQIPLKKLLTQYNVQNYFVFDMSIPDALLYLDMGFKVFTRQSEYEINPSFYDKACGVWLDEFHSHFIDEALILEHLKNGKAVCIVSPELHKRDYQNEWEEYKIIDQKLKENDKLMLCTDYPCKAREFFND